MLESDTMQQLIHEAANGIADVIREVAEPQNGAFRPRANRPDLIVVDPTIAPIFDQAQRLASELDIELPEAVFAPTQGIHTLLDARRWSRGVNHISEVQNAPMTWLEKIGYPQEKQLLSRIDTSRPHLPTRIIAVGGTRDSELPYVERPDERVLVGRGRRTALYVNEVSLTPNYSPDEDGPLDMTELGQLAASRRDEIVQRIRTPLTSASR